jgi:peroxiredoxin Q/BCP
VAAGLNEPGSSREEELVSIEEGKPAPDFELETDEGERVKLSDFRGKPVVLYFYPKDDTHASITSSPH